MTKNQFTLSGSGRGGSKRAEILHENIFLVISEILIYT
jgi:hypothetical protein